MLNICSNQKNNSYLSGMLTPHSDKSEEDNPHMFSNAKQCYVGKTNSCLNKLSQIQGAVSLHLE